MQDVITRTGLAQPTRLREGALSVESLTRAYLERIERLDPRLNASAHHAPAPALDTARARKPGVAAGPRWGVSTAAARRAAMGIVGELATSELAIVLVIDHELHPPSHRCEPFTTQDPIVETEAPIAAAARRVARAHEARGHRVSEAPPFDGTADEPLPRFQYLAHGGGAPRTSRIQPAPKRLREAGEGEGLDDAPAAPMRSLARPLPSGPSPRCSTPAATPRRPCRPGPKAAARPRGATRRTPHSRAGAHRRRRHAPLAHRPRRARVTRRC